MNRNDIICSVALFVGMLLLCGCESGTQTVGQGESGASTGNTDMQPIPLDDQLMVAKSLADSGEVLGKFTEISAEDSGVDFTNQWPDSFDYELPNSFITAGIAVGDFDGDGLPDFFASRRSDGGRLYQNLGGFRFEDVTEKYKLDLEGLWGTGATFADINNDGRLDLTVCGFDSANRVFINLGDHFENRAEELGLNFRGPSVVMTYADIDRDGDLDAYLLTNHSSSAPRPNIKVRQDRNGRPIVPAEFGESFYYLAHPDGRFLKEWAGRYDLLYRNDGDKFVDVSLEAGISKRPFWGLSATWLDYDDDGWPDLFVANDFKGPDHLYRNKGVNENGIVEFEDVSRSAFPHTPWFSMGSDAGDINNDGLTDILATDMGGTNHYRDKLSMGPMSGPDSRAWFLNVPNPPQYMRNSVFVNTGSTQFMEAAYLTSLAATDWTWTARLVDFDQDGWLDAYFTNGMSRDWFNGDHIAMAKKHHDDAGGGKVGEKVGYDYWFKTPRYTTENLAYRNKGDFEFENVSKAWGLDHLGVSTGGATGDLDGDGDLDLVVNGFDEPIKIYRNDVANGNRLKVYLAGRASNRSALGSKIHIETVDADGSTSQQVRYLNSNQGIMSSSESVAHFGLGSIEKVAKLTVYWPSGDETELSDLDANQSITITEPGNQIAIKSEGNSQTVEQIFERKEDFLANLVKHEELLYDDFKYQPLIPNKYSQLGPGTAWADVDNDGDQDFFHGGAGGSFSQLFRNDDGKLVDTRQKGFEADRGSEDMGSLFFDVDSDNDLDLYVVSGSGERRSSKKYFQDRLYLNDGAGNYESATEAWLPVIESSGSCVAGSDFDKDGDIDLFVGGRIVPGEYPSAPRSYLLVNSGDKLEDKTDSVAVGLATAGMVTSAVWTDVNNDGWSDLMVAYEWGPVRLFLNQDKKLVEHTQQSGLSSQRGWFNSITSGDLDNDGDTDYVVGNFGLNTKYSASDKKPELLFYGKFDDSGKSHIIEAKYENEVCLPRRGLGCSSHAIPMVKDKLPTFHEFAISPLEDIYSSEAIEESTRFEINNLNSMVLINESSDDSIQFRFLPLPRIAQVSPIFGAVMLDLDDDQFLDLVVAQNFNGPQRETGYMDGGVGLALKGLGDGRFEPIWPNQSGIAVAGDSTSLTYVDLNNSNQPALTFAVNDRFPQHFSMSSKVELGKISIRGQAANPNAVGSRLWLKRTGGSTRVYDLNSGGGYLSQSPSDLFISQPNDLEQLRIVWSDGEEQVIDSPKFDQQKLEVTRESGPPAPQPRP